MVRIRPDMVTCPVGPFVYNLASGECGIEVPTFGFGLPALSDLIFHSIRMPIQLLSTVQSIVHLARQITEEHLPTLRLQTLG